MEGKKEFGEGILFTFTNYVYSLLLANFLFVSVNAVFIFFFMALEPSFSNILIYMIALIPTGPAISGLLYVLEKLLRTKEAITVSDYFYGYKTNIKNTLLLWCMILAVFSVLLIDLQYLNQTALLIEQLISIVLYILFLLAVLISINMLILNAKFEFRKKDIFKLSIFYSFAHVKASLGNIFILLLIVFVTMLTSDFILLFVASIIGLLLIKNARRLLTDVEATFIKRDK
ncbi:MULTISPECIES: DUF624 domain-containing protein [unclassified Niallia]|uniref:DUF624 domain-containing protein n=1 Tax=unclassified Niallia TaxID=2837522 RepID=UPI001EDBFA52|nr:MULTISPECIES: DUF624 domain-containing protein [unclassified Niallia]MDL0436449.1 DUF624 domain-containing protein [Niallia sp. SS-2023]UPO88656.1 DUF624 domain-containing protein [Niallia sp. Man26]